MNAEAFQQKLKQLDKPVVVDVWAPWCGPCKMIEPALHQLAEEYKGRVDVLKINADDNRELLGTLGIYGIPTLLVFRDGQEITRTTGAQHKAGLARLFEAALSGEQPAAAAGVPLFSRLVRMGLGLLILWLTWSYHASPLFYLLGGIVMFTAVYDRCPIWQAISTRVTRILRPST